MTRAFLLPFVLHILLAFALYAWLTLARQTAVRHGEAQLSDYRRADGDAPRAVPVARNLASQFELPVIAYFCAVLLLLFRAVGTMDVVAAWAFAAGRFVHTLVQTLSGNVSLRGLVFTINAAAVAWLAAHVAWLVLFGPLP